MSKGRLPSLFLLSTEPVGGIWFPPRAKDQANKARKWHWEGRQIHWQPEAPEGSDKKQEFMERLLVQVAGYRQVGAASFLKLSGTSKTGITWSLPAVGACPQVDETCGTCYALDGFYRTNIAAQVGRVMRLEYLRKLIASGRLAEWVDWATDKIGRLRPVESVPKNIPLDNYLNQSVSAHEKPVAYFRWHDSGDIFHADYAKAVFEVCRRTPEVLHWLPTRMGGLLAKLVKSGERLPPNLAVQISCHRDGILEKAQHAAIAAIRGLQPEARIGVTYAHAGTKSRMVQLADVHASFGPSASLCPATVAANSEDRVCTGCRRCWAQANPTCPIIYAVHLGS
jgi:protein gp37